MSSPDPWTNFMKGSELRAGIPLAPPLRTKEMQPRRSPQLCVGHIPVLLHETIDALLGPGLEGIYVDGTFGRGGHTTEILKRLPPNSRLVAFDVDPTAIAVGRELERRDPRFQIVHRPFADVGDVLRGQQLAGVMIDIGFSSPQVDEQHRGFSVVDDGPFDLRMNQEGGKPMSEWMLTARPEEVAWIIREHGEDDDGIMPLRIADAVLEEQRRTGAYKSTLDIAEVIRQVKHGMDDRGQHPAKLSFQSFRIFINHEMEQLSSFMEGAVPLLRPGANCVVITFKRPEATIVKRFIRDHEEPPSSLEKAVSPQRLKELYPLLQTSKPFAVRQPCAPMVPKADEIEKNRRCRSSMTHVIQRLERTFRPDLAGVPPRSLPELFKRPRAVFSIPGRPPGLLASSPPRTSGSVAVSVLQGT
eukprot:gnl/TRDRNA2_/TRDRNA2_150902_c1_seq1.p1 gnl/TRDRNA2_/TRDRNA2_150902_c1~~gnl/TRDRNA2_/TRDRNA2_150902_c1_seq1.p1  ORF type:complete len:415 (+),score=76.22 gnl/TRDRNA2_/TRDRNA2_150902_c1_seq1:2-1246(+)